MNDESVSTNRESVFVPQRKRVKLCFALGDTYHIGLLEGDPKQIMSVLDDLSSILCDVIGIYWFDQQEKKYKNVAMWSEVE